VSERRVALTFDAEHPSRPANRPDGAEAILDALAKAGASATFFVQGRWATAFPSTARRIADDGHVVASHSNYHARMTMLSPDGLRRDLAEAEERIARLTGVDPRPWFRCPFGDGADDPAVLDGLRAAGYHDVGWDLDTVDWREETEASGIVRSVVDGVLASSSRDVVVLQHTWSAPTVAAIPEVLGRLAAEGVAFVTVREVLASAG
jgi:peptidoglycan-N-acetylglucosamine deacetylase